MSTSPVVDPAVVDAYVAAGHWGTRSLSSVVRQRADERPDHPAVISEHDITTWAAYDAGADAVAGALGQVGLGPGDRVGVWLPDGGSVHAAMVGAERAGVTAVGIGPRAGDREAGYLLSSSGARALITGPGGGGVPGTGLSDRLAAAGAPIEHHLALPGEAGTIGAVLVDGSPAPTPKGDLDGRALGPNDLFLINSTSGTTGLPKRVRQFQNRWFFYHQLVTQAIDIQPDDVFMSVVPAPFGFGLWTAHFTPTLAGVPVVVMERFSADGALELIARHRVTVLCCVSTQFIMMLASGRLGSADLSSLRAIFTGGEAVPYHRAAEFEDRTGALVLQFYGSNETGAFSNTAASDTREDRLTTCGKVLEVMQPRLFDEDGADITATGGPGQPGCKGPATCAGYEDDPQGNARLYTADGWMLMEDVACIDDRGFVRLTGRRGDFIIRGGKNISAAAVEDAVSTHPAVALVAAVPVPDDVFGERVGVFVVPREGGGLTLEALAAHLQDAGYSKESFPEHIFVVDDLPRASGGKVAKGLLRQEVARRAPGR